MLKIKCGAKLNSYPKYFIDSDHEEYNMDAANSINKLFVTVGPDLAKTITDPGIAEEK